MDWTVYWFILGLCRHRGGGHVLRDQRRSELIPVFLIGFPLVSVPPLTTVGAIGTSLLLETSGFGTGLYRYFRLRMVDFATAGG